jgi:hypothetical protein
VEDQTAVKDLPQVVKDLHSVAKDLPHVVKDLHSMAKDPQPADISELKKYAPDSAYFFLLIFFLKF